MPSRTPAYELAGFEVTDLGQVENADQFDPCFLEKSEALFQGGEQTWIGARREHLGGMRLEGEDRGGVTGLDQTGEQGTVTAVYAVEHADGDRSWIGSRRPLAPGRGEDLHDARTTSGMD